MWDTLVLQLLRSMLKSNKAVNISEEFYVWFSVHHTLIYIKKTNLMHSSSMFIGNCKIEILQLPINILLDCIKLVFFIYISEEMSAVRTEIRKRTFVFVDTTDMWLIYAGQVCTFVGFDSPFEKMVSQNRSKYVNGDKCFTSLSELLLV